MKRMIKIKKLEGMRGFVLLWIGQFVSIFATRMTNFAITLWAWDLTGTATGMVLVGVIGFLPGVLLGPIAGTLVDRWNRKLVMALSDAGAALSTVILLALFYTGRAEIWHLYLTLSFSGIPKAGKAYTPNWVMTVCHTPRSGERRFNSSGSSG